MDTYLEDDNKTLLKDPLVGTYLVEYGDKINVFSPENYTDDKEAFEAAKSFYLKV